MQRLLCVKCGDSIHPDTAAQHAGLCVPCVRGNTLSIEERQEAQRKRIDAERAYRVSPEHQYWTSLVSTVHDGSGFDSLSQGDKLYYLLSILTGEVHNGGFDQFFSNSSGDRFAETVEALRDVGNTDTLNLLLQAKAAAFGDVEVSADRMTRFASMRTSSEENPECQQAAQALEALDEEFWAHATDVDAALARLVETYRLYPSGH